MKFFLSSFFLFFSLSIVAQVGFEWIVEPSYNYAYDYSSGLAKVSSGSTIHTAGFIDLKGNIVVPLKYSFSERKVNGSVIFYKISGEGNCLFNVHSNSIVNNDRYDLGTDFSEGLAIVTKGGFTYAINEKGEKAFQLPGDMNAARFGVYSDGMATFYVGKLGFESWGAVNDKGEVIIQPKYKYITNFSDGVAAFQSGSYWGVIDKQGRVVLAPKYNWINSFSKGMAVVRQDKQHGYIDVTGQKLIPIMYKHAHSFSEGLAAVENAAGKWGFIDKKNKYVIRPQFAQAFSFHDGLARVENKAGKVGYIDVSGKLVIDYQFEDGRDLSEGMIAVKQRGKWGYISLLDPPHIENKQEDKKVKQPIVQGKKLKYGKGVLISGDEVQLEVFDFEKEDGDSISLFFNNDLVLENYLLKSKPVVLHLNLKSNHDNKLVLHAHNLGRKPPNTAAIRITDSQGRVQLVEMISDLARSDVLYFFRDTQDVSGQVEFTVSYSDVDEIFKRAVDDLPNREVIFFKGSRLRKNVMESFIIYDNSLSKSYLCEDDSTGKVAYFGPLNKKVDVKYVEGRYNVLDFVCQKAIITNRGKETAVYYTTELPFAYSPFSGIPGVVLKYSEKTRFGMKTVTANKVVFSKLSDSLFNIEGYELQSKAEKQKQKMKEFRAIIEARKKAEQAAKKKLINKTAPPITFDFLDGTTKSLSAYKGKIVVLNFWFVECPPCKLEMPKLNTLVSSFKGQDVVFISVARNSIDKVKTFLRATRFDYLPSVGTDQFDAFGVQTFPSSAIIDKSGNVIYFSSGLQKNIEIELKDVILRALK